MVKTTNKPKGEPVTQKDRVQERKEAKEKAQEKEGSLRKKERIQQLKDAADAIAIVQPPREVPNDIIMMCLKDEGFSDNYVEKDIIASKVKEDGLARVVMSDGEKIPIMHADIKMPEVKEKKLTVPTHDSDPNS